MFGHHQITLYVGSVNGAVMKHSWRAKLEEKLLFTSSEIVSMLITAKLCLAKQLTGGLLTKLFSGIIQVMT